MLRIDSIRYFLGIVPGSKSERIETVCAAALLTYLVSVSMMVALCRFDAVSDTLGIQGAIVDVAIRLMAMFTFIAIYIILFQYISNGIYHLAYWIIGFPIKFIISKIKGHNGRTSISHVISSLKITHTSYINISIPILVPEDISPNTYEQAQARAMIPVLLLPPPENYKFVLMLTDKCSDKDGLYNEFIREEDESTITESLDFAVKYWSLVKLGLIPNNMQKYLCSVPSRYCPIKRGQLSNLVKEVKKSIAEYKRAEGEGYEPEDKEREIYERWMVLKNRFKYFRYH